MTAAKKKPQGRGNGAGALKKSDVRCKSSALGTAGEVQRETILRLLAIRPHNSYELRRAGCYQCPTRVHELRRAGHPIDTARVTVIDQDGFEHPRVALYSLPGAPEGAE